MNQFFTLGQEVWYKGKPYEVIQVHKILGLNKVSGYLYDLQYLGNGGNRKWDREYKVNQKYIKIYHEVCDMSFQELIESL